MFQTWQPCVYICQIFVSYREGLGHVFGSIVLWLKCADVFFVYGCLLICVPEGFSKFTDRNCAIPEIRPKEQFKVDFTESDEACHSIIVNVCSGIKLPVS